MTDQPLLFPSIAPIHDEREGVRHWAYREAPDWVRECVPLNGDDISVVSLVPNEYTILADNLNTGAWCTVALTSCAKGTLVWGFHA